MLISYAYRSSTGSSIEAEVNAQVLCLTLSLDVLAAFPLISIVEN
jgi:hypothetical protein